MTRFSSVPWSAVIAVVIGGSVTLLLNPSFIVDGVALLLLFSPLYFVCFVVVVACFHMDGVDMYISWELKLFVVLEIWGGGLLCLFVCLFTEEN